MRVTLWAAVLRWNSIAVTALFSSVLLFLFFTDRAASPGVLATTGVVVYSLLLASYHRCLVHAGYRICALETDLAVAHTDPVTGLAVRRIAEQHLIDAAGREVTVAVIDVDGMHDINTAHTHDGGDRYLASLAERLVAAGEPGDLVARLGGDEFVVVTSRDPGSLAGSLVAVLAAPVTIGSTTRSLGVSIGICRTLGGDPRVALGRADRAMYTAKRTGSGVAHYDPARDGAPPPSGVRPAVRHRDRRPARPAEMIVEQVRDGDFVDEAGPPVRGETGRCAGGTSRGEGGDG
ncbi:hypothetical protein GCM10009541_53790 [Micromonospora gifhornensis]|uniref:GGDEF domain-containing protein n=1 Tax=Micromonospora gifhornensis TaxID=84594 RepID=A0ABQ4IKI6_9ACTN|nr:diguanylate cyclase [Micromonospora gifhornensis]GIJ18412.1 hypothetical protein Vgi01_50960 [Micromonospora gifhornensis]